MLTIFDSLTDSIVVVQDQEGKEASERSELELNNESHSLVTFCNVKSIELFGFDLIENTKSDPLSIKLELPRFIPIGDI